MISEKRLVKKLESEARASKDPLKAIQGYMELSRWAAWEGDHKEAERTKNLAQECFYKAVLAACPNLQKHIEALEDL